MSLNHCFKLQHQQNTTNGSLFYCTHGMSWILRISRLFIRVKMWTQNHLPIRWCPRSMNASWLKNFLSIQTPHIYKLATMKSPYTSITTLTSCAHFSLKQYFWRGLLPIFSYTKIRSLGQISLMILMFWIGSRYSKLNSSCWHALGTLFVPLPVCKLKMKETHLFQTSILYCEIPISLLKWSLIRL